MNKVVFVNNAEPNHPKSGRVSVSKTHDFIYIILSDKATNKPAGSVADVNTATT